MADDSATVGDNGFDPETFLAFVQRIEALQLDIDEIMAAAREECEPIRQDIADIRREAFREGIPKAEFAAVIRKRRLEARAAAVGDDFDEAARLRLEDIWASLEKLADELPGLGGAARDRARAAAQ